MKTSSRILILIAILACVCLGFWLDRDRPSEKSRVRHPQAYSVCVPQGWSAEVTYNHGGEVVGGTHGVDGLTLTPDEFVGLRPTLTVDRLKDAPSPQAMRDEGWGSGTFQDQPAYVIEKILPHGMIRAACFGRSGTWFAIVEKLSVAATAQKDTWWRYLETFRYPDGAPPTIAPVAATATGSTQPFNFPMVGQ